MEIKFKIETLGYIEAEFSSSKGNVKIRHSSDYGDKFQELLNKFFFIHEIVKTNKKDYLPYSFDLMWEDDFIHYMWEISMNTFESFINIKVFELYPNNNEHKIELINQEIKFEHLFHNIYLSLEETFVDFGFIGYKRNWEVGNFPIFEYITLKADKEKIELRSINDSNEEEWKQKISITQELKIINHSY